MDLPLPLPEAVPGHPYLFLFLNLLTFLLHIIAMNILLGVTAVLLLDRKISKTALELGMGKTLSIAFAFTVNMGVAPLLFLQVLYGHLFYTSSILMAWYWISLIAILIVAYYSTYAFASSLKKIYLFITFICVLWTAFMFINNMTMMIQPSVFKEYFNNSFGTILNLKEPTLIPRYLHMVTGAIAVSYLFLALLSRLKGYSIDYVSICLKRFFFVSLFQILWGTILVLTLSSDVMVHLLLEIRHMIFLLLGIVCSILAMIYAYKTKIWHCVVFSALTLVFMIITRHNVRSLYLNPYFDLLQLQVSPQTFNLILFLVIFLVGLITVLYLLRLSFKKV